MRTRQNLLFEDTPSMYIKYTIKEISLDAPLFY